MESFPTSQKEVPEMRKPKAAIRNAMLLLACIIVFLVCAIIIANNVGQGLP